MGGIERERNGEIERDKRGNGERERETGGSIKEGEKIKVNG